MATPRMPLESVYRPRETPRVDLSRTDIPSDIPRRPVGDPVGGPRQRQGRVDGGAAPASALSGRGRAAAAQRPRRLSPGEGEPRRRRGVTNRGDRRGLIAPAWNLRTVGSGPGPGPGQVPGRGATGGDAAQVIASARHLRTGPGQGQGRVETRLRKVEPGRVTTRSPRRLRTETTQDPSRRRRPSASSSGSPRRGRGGSPSTRR